MLEELVKLLAPSTRQNQLGDAFLSRQQLVHRLYYVLAFAPTERHSLGIFQQNRKHLRQLHMHSHC
jgi:hypothetical protein